MGNDDPSSGCRYGTIDNGGTDQACTFRTICTSIRKYRQSNSKVLQSNNGHAFAQNGNIIPT
eukprot:1635652-Amphidinium_carterae.1